MQTLALSGEPSSSTTHLPSGCWLSLLIFVRSYRLFLWLRFLFSFTCVDFSQLFSKDLCTPILTCIHPFGSQAASNGFFKVRFIPTNGLNVFIHYCGPTSGGVVCGWFRLLLVRLYHLKLYFKWFKVCLDV